MAPKSRRQDDESLPAAKVQRGGNERAEQLATTLAALNGQFASWVAKHKETDLYKFWTEGVRDYIKHATKLLDDFSDILPKDGVAALQQAASDAEDRSQATPSQPMFTVRPVLNFGAPDGSAAGQPSSSGKAAATATGFMAPPAATFTAATTMSQPSTTTTTPATSLFGAPVPSTGAAAATTTPAATGAFSFGAATASAAAATTKDGSGATDVAQPGAFAFSASSSSAIATTTAALASNDKAATGPGLFSYGAAATAGDKAAATTSTTAATAFSFGAAAGSAPAAATPSTAPASTSGFTFGSAASSAAGSIFGAAAGSIAASTTPAFSFAVASSTVPAGGDAAKKDGAAAGSSSTAGGSSTAAPGGLFSFGTGAPAGGTGTFGGFGAAVGSAPAFSFGAPLTTAAAGGGKEGEEDGEAEPEPDECDKEPSLKVDDNVEFLFKEKARLQVPVKGDGGKISGWEAKGMGYLSVRRSKAEGSKPYIALFTESGRCLYQAYFNKTMKLVVSDKQKSVAFTAPWSPDGVSPPALNAALFQLAAGKNHAFEEVITKLQADMTE